MHAIGPEKKIQISVHSDKGALLNYFRQDVHYDGLPLKYM